MDDEPESENVFEKAPGESEDADEEAEWDRFLVKGCCSLGLNFCIGCGWGFFILYKNANMSFFCV